MNEKGCEETDTKTNTQRREKLQYLFRKKKGMKGNLLYQTCANNGNQTEKKSFFSYGILFEEKNSTVLKTNSIALYLYRKYILF